MGIGHRCWMSITVLRLLINLPTYQLSCESECWILGHVSGYVEPGIVLFREMLCMLLRALFVCHPGICVCHLFCACKIEGSVFCLEWGAIVADADASCTCCQDFVSMLILCTDPPGLLFLLMEWICMVWRCLWKSMEVWYIVQDDLVCPANTDVLCLVTLFLVLVVVYWILCCMSWKSNCECEEYGRNLLCGCMAWIYIVGDVLFLDLDPWCETNEFGFGFGLRWFLET